MHRITRLLSASTRKNTALLGGSRRGGGAGASNTDVKIATRVLMPWEERSGAFSYDSFPHAWTFLDRTLAAVVEMSPEDISTRSLRLNRRDILKDIEVPILRLRKASTKQQQQKRGNDSHLISDIEMAATQQEVVKTARKLFEAGSALAVSVTGLGSSKAKRLASSDGRVSTSSNNNSSSSCNVSSSDMASKKLKTDTSTVQTLEVTPVSVSPATGLSATSPTVIVASSTPVKSSGKRLKTSAKAKKKVKKARRGSAMSTSGGDITTSHNSSSTAGVAEATAGNSGDAAASTVHIHKI